MHMTSDDSTSLASLTESSAQHATIDPSRLVHGLQNLTRDLAFSFPSSSSSKPFDRQPCTALPHPRSRVALEVTILSSFPRQLRVRRSCLILGARSQAANHFLEVGGWCQGGESGQGAHFELEELLHHFCTFAPPHDLLHSFPIAAACGFLQCCGGEIAISLLGFTCH